MRGLFALPLKAPAYRADLLAELRFRGLGAILATVAAGAIRFAVLLSASPVLTPDTFDYARQSRLSVLSTAFWTSQHPPLLPLLWKPFPGLLQSADPAALGDLSPVLLLNGAVAAVCWGVLAVELSRLARTETGRWAVLLAVLSLSLAPDVSGWDASALSESISISLVALVIALTVRYVRAPSKVSAAGLAAAVVCAVLVRDTNLVLCIVALLPVVAVVRRHGRVVICALALAAALSAVGQIAGNRAEIPTRNAIADAILYFHAGPWFRAHGLPVGRDTPGLLFERPVIRFDRDPRTAPLRAWLDERGRGAWLHYLATHPSRTVSVVHDLGAIYDPPRSVVGPYWGGAARGLFVHGPWLLLLALPAAVVLVLRGRSRELLAPVAFLVATVPVAVAIWDADGRELSRHSIVLAVVGQLVPLTLCVLGAEEALGRDYAVRLKAATAMPK